MASRLQLQAMLEELIASENVYCNPPSSLKMSYPCIVYSMNKIDETYANDNPYTIANQYSATVIDRDPDSELVDKMLTLPKCSFNRFYKKDNLNHWVFALYY